MFFYSSIHVFQQPDFLFCEEAPFAPLNIFFGEVGVHHAVKIFDIVAKMFMELNRSGRPKNAEGKLVIIRPGKDENDYRIFYPQQV